MTDTTKTEALRLADQAAGMSSKYKTPSYERGVLNGCVQELRRLSAVEAERDELREHLQFVERWAVHHGTKPHMTAEQALSVIQHYPPISDITKSYSDGKTPDTPNPWAERDRLAAECEALRADAERYRWLTEKLGETQLPTLIERITQGYVADYKPSIDAAIDAAMGGKE